MRRRTWKTPDGRELLSFIMLTINADGHEVMQHFHKPPDAKRIVVILDEGDYDRWLDAPSERMPDFLTRYPAGGWWQNRHLGRREQGKRKAADQNMGAG